MKYFNSKIMILPLLLAAVSAVAVSCSDFLDRTPITEPSSSTYLSGESQVYSYINGLYKALPTFSQWGMGPRGEDKNSDNIVAEEYDRRINGEYTAFQPEAESAWSTGYQNLRDVNYFFEYYLVSEEDETDVLRSLRGEAYFLRAYWHFYLLKRFGNIVYMDGFWDGKATLEGLQIPATPRKEVAEKIIGDLETAAGLLFSRSKFSGLRISKEAALTLAMNVALYEGSWEKYHANDAFRAENADHNAFFTKVMTLGDELFKCGISLNTRETDPFGAADGGEAFANLFNQKDYSNVPEALFWRKYSLSSGLSHYYVNMLAAGQTDSDGPAGVSKSLVDNYLNLDGSFIDPDDEKFHDFNETFTGRDPRLGQTVMHTGRYFRSPETSTSTKPMLVAEHTEENEDMLFPPALTGGSNQQNITGYHIGLGIDETLKSESSWDTGYIIIRYAEALLAYAEAAEELGRCDDTVLGMTVKALRDRAGVTYVKPSEMGKDEAFPDYAAGADLTLNMQEIRRERRAELALQGFRLDDILRWGAHDLLKGKRGLGAYIGEDGVLYKAFYSSEDLSKLDAMPRTQDGWLDPLATVLPNGYRFNENRDYLLPISPDELNLNKKLSPNPGWE